MTRKHFFTSISVLALCAVALPAHAQDSGLYANVGITFVSLDLPSAPLSDTTSVAGVPVQFSGVLPAQSISTETITGRIGYRIFDYLAIEGEAGFGLGGDSSQQSVPVDINSPLGNVTTNVDVDLNGDIGNYFGVFARGILPVSDQFELHARVGYGTASADVDFAVSAQGATSTGTQSGSIEGIAYGVGGQFNFSGNQGIRLDYALIDDDASADILTATYVFNF